jgi:hypothetical protein
MGEKKIIDGETVVDLALQATRAKTEDEKIGAIGSIIDAQHQIPEDAVEGDIATALKRLLGSIVNRFHSKGE